MKIKGLATIILMLAGVYGWAEEPCYEGTLTLTPACVQRCGACCAQALIETQPGQTLPVGQSALPLAAFADGRRHRFCGAWYLNAGLCNQGECRFFAITRIDDTRPKHPVYDIESGLLHLPSVEANGRCYSVILKIPPEKLGTLLQGYRERKDCPDGCPVR